MVHARSEHARGAAAVRRLRDRARRYLIQLEREDAELSILVVDDEAMRSLNRSWRGKDRATDVLSFPSAGPDFAHLLGDVVISLETAERVAREEGKRVGEELDRYLAHGMLHLLGHDHVEPEAARAMAVAEDALVGRGLVSAAGIPRTARGQAARASRSSRPARATGAGHRECRERQPDRQPGAGYRPPGAGYRPSREGGAGGRRRTR